ncbi:MAG: hypothetical protein BWX84_01988 [Verrucomicrobia bacterium ADurb.Bin118]|nr:MAG: hypothetical protein BWX84_01988 [Verrucomicrobia bacterium ADurb.Bin118]
MPVGIDLSGGGQSDDLLGGGTEKPLALGGVPDLEQHVLRGLGAPALLPNLPGLQRGHEHLDGAGAVHFLADDLLDLAQNAQAERQEGVHAARQFADQTGAEQEFMGKDFRVRRGFAESGNQCLRPTHVRGEISGEKGEPSTPRRYS